MQTVSPSVIKDKKILLRLDIDVPLVEMADSRQQTADSKQTNKKIFKVAEDYRLKAGVETLQLCLEHASEVIIIGHIGRPSYAVVSEGKPEGEVRRELSVEPIYDWLVEQGFKTDLELGKLKLLENLRFEEGEEKCDLVYAKELASLGDVYINEAFASHHPASSTTVLPQLLPSFAGLHFAKEVEMLTKVRENPLHPLVAVVGGVKIEDKKPALLSLAKVADQVLVGGKIAEELRKEAGVLPAAVYLGKNNPSGLDITAETAKGWSKIISFSQMVLWNGPLGKVGSSEFVVRSEEGVGAQRGAPETEKGSLTIAQAIIASGAESIVGGGDTISFLSKHGLLEKFNFVSTGGGAMLKFLAEGTLPSIKALNEHSP